MRCKSFGNYRSRSHDRDRTHTLDAHNVSPQLCGHNGANVDDQIYDDAPSNDDALRDVSDGYDHSCIDPLKNGDRVSIPAYDVLSHFLFLVHSLSKSTVSWSWQLQSVP